MVRTRSRLQKKACHQFSEDESAGEDLSKHKSHIKEEEPEPLDDANKNDTTIVEVPKHYVKIEVEPVESNANDQSGTEDIEKCDVIIKEECEDADDSEELSSNIFSKYEHLLKNITILKKDGTSEFDENSRSGDSATDEDPDDPDSVPSLDEDDEEEEDDDDNDEEESKAFTCFDCDFTCNFRGEFAAHLLIHKGKPTLKCEVCEDVFTKPATLKAHLIAKHPDSDRILKCKFCKEMFSSNKLRLNHVRSVHADKMRHQCKYCSKKFIRKSGFDQHMKFHLDSRPFKCNICKVSFRTKGNRNSHMKQHFAFKEYKCDQCDKDFIRKDQLKRHILSVHKKTCTYKCSICNRSLKGHVLNHLRIHMDEKQYKCTECDKSFVQSSQLTVHLRIHTGVKPYKCSFCKASFSHSSACRLHMRTHTGERPAKCQLCPAAFTQLPHLKKHMRCVHKAEKPYVCVPCNKFFNTKAELEGHTSSKKCKFVAS